MRELVLKDDCGVVTGYVYFTESEWRGLLDRFDIRRVQKIGCHYVIQVDCVLCKKYIKCKKCPIAIAGGGCLKEMKKVSGGLLMNLCTVYVLTGSISWNASVDYDVREGIKKVSRVIRALPCVRVRKTLKGRS